MGKTGTIILIVAAGFIFLLAAMVFLLWVLKDRIVPERADFPDDEEPDEDELMLQAAEARRPSSFGRPEPEAEYDETEEEPESAASSEPEEPSSCTLEDILSSGYFLGRTPAECLVPTSCLSEDRTEIMTEGGLFGAYAYGGITLSPDEAGIKRADSFYVICRELGYDECRENLAGIFGEPTAEGSDEESGTVYASFGTEWGTLWLSRGEGNDYLNINLVRE